MSSINLKAIVIGSVVDVIGGFLAGLVFFIIEIVVMLAQGVAQGDVMRHVLADPSFFPINLAIGFSCLAAGSYLAARIAHARELLHSAIVALVGLGVSVLYLVASNNESVPAWYHAVSFTLALPVALGAGYLAKRRAQHAQPDRAA
jgi:hypothetical protein